MKMDYGYVTNPKTGVSKNIIVKAVTPNTIRDTLIGGGIVLLGIAYLTVTAFKNGSNKFEAAEMQTLMDAGLINEIS